MGTHVKIHPDYVDVFCESRDFHYIKEGFMEGESVVFMIGNDGIEEYFSLAYIRRATQDDFWATEEGMLAGAYEEINERSLEEQLTITRRP